MIADRFLLLTAFLVLCAAGVTIHAAQPLKPNVVLILADDLGWGDLGCYRAESKVPTPNVDKLASQGMCFTQAYCPVSVCSPTRYALMTGSYPWRSWKKHGVLANWEEPMIEDGQLTLPAMLRQAGYVTAGFGKWHLGARYQTTDGRPPAGSGKFKADGTGLNVDIAAPISGGPLDRGFDRWFGFICASEMLVFEGNRAVSLLSHSLYQPPAVPGTNELAKVTVAEFLPLITGKSTDFLRKHAASGAGKPFFLYYAPYVPHIPLAVSEEYRGRTMAGDYGDYVHQLDHEIGRLLNALNEIGFVRNTLVIFASDNGSQFRLTGEGHLPNGELRGTKGHIHEGGVRTPLIARWPGHVPEGTTNTEIVALNDWLATLAALTGQELSADAGGDSYNILPLLVGSKVAKPIRTEVMVQSSGGQHALRQGQWKFVQGRGKAPLELYNLDADPAEKRDLHAEKPEIAARLQARLQTLLTSKRTAP